MSKRLFLQSKRQSLNGDEDISIQKQKRLSRSALEKSVREAHIGDVLLVPKNLGTPSGQKMMVTKFEEDKNVYSVSLSGLEDVSLQSHEDSGEYCTFLCTVEKDKRVRAELFRSHDLRFDFPRFMDEGHNYEKPPDEGKWHMVGLMFGNARVQKQQRMYYLRERHNASLLTSIDESLKDVESLGVVENEDARLVILQRALPPYNEKATRCQDVYDIASIYGGDEQLTRYDEDIMCVFSTTESVGLSKEPTFFQSHVQFIKHKIGPSKELNDDDHTLKKTARLLFFLNNLMVLYRSCHGSTRDGQAFFNALRTLNTHCTNEFYDKAKDGSEHRSTKSVPTLHNEGKLLNYIFILALHVDNFCTDVSFFAYDLQLPVFKVCNMFKAIGCKIEMKSECTSATLMVPLKLNAYAFMTNSKMKRGAKEMGLKHNVVVKREPKDD